MDIWTLSFEEKTRKDRIGMIGSIWVVALWQWIVTIEEYVWCWSKFQYSGASDTEGHMGEQSKCPLIVYPQLCHKKTYKSLHSPSWWVAPPSERPVDDINASCMVSGLIPSTGRSTKGLRVVEVQADCLHAQPDLTTPPSS